MSDTPQSPPPPPRSRRPVKVPPALRPGDTDDILEGSRLTRISVWGLIVSMVISVFIFGYWVHEPTRMADTTTLFNQHSLIRGAQYFALPVNDRTGAQNFRGVGCATCHGDNAEGGIVNKIPHTFLNSITGTTETVFAPDLTDVFARYAVPGALPPGYTTPLEYIRATIDHGRTNGNLGDGDDMPTWSQDYGGPLTSQEIDDLILYLESIQRKPGSTNTSCGQPNNCQSAAS
jgi:mono/diheme cytochrome c family protein